MATTNLDALTLSGALTVTGAQTFTGALSIDDTTDTSSGTTGSIHTDGGVGIAKKLYVGTTITAAGAVSIDDTTDTSSGVTGSLHTDGGVGIAKQLYVAGKTKMSVALADGNLGDGYGGALEAELNTTGAQAGHIAAASAWVNVNGTVGAGGHLVAARNDGIYVNTGDAGDLTNAIAIFGARMHIVSGGNETVAAPFSINVDGTTTDAIFHLYNSDGAAELGYVVDSTTDDGKIGAVPLYIDGATSTKYYVRIYDGAS